MNKHRINEELVCIDALQHVIRQISPSTVIEIQPELNDPPDFTISVNNHRFPAEVTSIVEDQQYHAQCNEICRKICMQATIMGVLQGTYVFRISRSPCIPRPNSSDYLNLCKVALSYIENSRDVTQCSDHIIRTSSEGKIQIAKISGDGATVELLRIGAVWREHHVRNQLRTLIQRSVDDKRKKLSRVGIVPKSALLLLYDAFGYADPPHAVSALHEVSGYEWFHSVFWVASFTDRPNLYAPSEPGREGKFLYSVNPEWHDAGTM